MAENDQRKSDPAEDDFATLFAASEAKGTRHRKEFAVGDLVRGSVIAIGQGSAFVAIGGKGEATIDLAEFRDPTTGAVSLVVGDQLEATVVDDGSQSGTIVLRRTLGRGGHIPAELEQAMAHRIPIEGLVTGENKGGFDVQIGGVRAFCPGSQIDKRRPGERVPASEYIGQRFLFRVSKIDSGGRNVVVSRRDLLEEEAAAKAAETWKKLQVGVTVQGTVTNIRDFGAFVDLGGVEGLIHVSELGYSRVGHPSEVLQVGQHVEARVLKIEQAPTGRRQVGLSMKALAADPWSTIQERFPAGTSASGTVRRVEAFGAFIEIAPGLEGLAHVSKLSLDRRLSHARQAVSIGDQVEVTILGVDLEKRRISLSMIERARQNRDAAAAEELAEEQAAMAKTNQRRSLATFADLLPKK